MKHGRKMILVDADTTKKESSTHTTKNELTNAIKSLTNANEFSRSYFGPNSATISQLNNDLQVILDRTDLNSDDKLKLYNQGLNRYLFLQRESDNSVHLDRSILDSLSSSPRSPSSAASTWGAASSSFTSGRSSPVQPEQPVPLEAQIIPLEHPPTNIFLTPNPATEEKVDPSVYSTPKNNYVKEVLQKYKFAPKKYKSNLPRTTPKADILRKERKEKREADFFYNWNGSRQKGNEDE